MIRVMMGEKGSGKTKTFIDFVNKSIEEEKGDVVCITACNRHLFDLRPSIRLINTSEFEIDCYKTFYGFLCGIISGNYDITHIYIDSVTKIANSDIGQLTAFMEYVEKLSKMFNINFTITVSEKIENATEDLKKYLIEF